MSLKLSLHGYILLIMKNQKACYTQVFSLNGDQLLSVWRENEMYELKYAQLTQKEDQLLMVINQRLSKDTGTPMAGKLRVVRLYDLDKRRFDGLEQSFY